MPTLVIHGTHDRIVPYKIGQEIAETIVGARLVTFERGGHGLQGRDAVKVNRLIRDFVQDRPQPSGTVAPTTERVTPPRSARSGRRILWLSSPIGLGPHPARRGDRQDAAGDLPRRDGGLPRRRSLPARGGAPGRAGPSGHRPPRQRERALRGLGRRPRAARLQRPVGHGRDHDGQLHGVRRRRGVRPLRPVGGRRGLGSGLPPAREPGAEAGALRVPHRLHRRAPHARRSGHDGVHPRPREERREHRPPAAAPRRARPVDHGGRRGGRARPGVRARPSQHAAVGPRALPVLRLHLSLRARPVPGQGRPARRASAIARASA